MKSSYENVKLTTYPENLAGLTIAGLKLIQVIFTIMNTQ